jgi:hypothetical protein
MSLAASHYTNHPTRHQTLGRRSPKKYTASRRHQCHRERLELKLMQERGTLSPPTYARRQPIYKQQHRPNTPTHRPVNTVTTHTMNHTHQDNLPAVPRRRIQEEHRLKIVTAQPEDFVFSPESCGRRGWGCTSMLLPWRKTTTAGQRSLPPRVPDPAIQTMQWIWQGNAKIHG